MRTENNYLYHYTNVSTLALILKYQNIKFSSLDSLDDSEEEMVKDKQEYGKYCFVSSWTADVYESIPMWSMYTNICEGIRIRLPKEPFKEYFVAQNDVRTHLNQNDCNIEGNGFKAVVPPEEIFDREYYIPTIYQSNLLKKIKYTDDIKELYPQIVEFSNGNTTLKMESLGECKNKYWSFQNEWRYKLIIFPFGYKEMQDEAVNNQNKGLLNKIHDCVDLPINFYLLKLEPTKFKKMQITLSPKISDGNKLIVELLVDKYNPGIKILDSKLLNKLR